VLFRHAYYRRAEQAKDWPDTYYSSISDGMCSSKTKIPSRASNIFEFNPTLPVHIQAELVHGRALHVYRTYHNVHGGSNMATHCWLLSLEQESKKRIKQGKKTSLPEVIYHQIDGGPENTAKATLAMCELLVAKRLVQKVVLSRLIVGHTHEDIDAVFALIWTKLRLADALTPDKFAESVFRAVFSKEKEFKLFDLWVIPDYARYFEGYISPSLGRYAKGQWSQMQIIFEATTRSERYPTGVKITHRAYSSDEVKVLKRVPTPPEVSTDPLYDPIANLEREIDEDIKQKGFHGIIWDENEPGPVSSRDCSVEDTIGYRAVRYVVKTFPLPEHEPTIILTRNTAMADISRAICSRIERLSRHCVPDGSHQAQSI